MSESKTLTERLSESLKISAQRRAEEQAAELLELSSSQDVDELEIVASDPATGTPLYGGDTSEMDAQSDHDVEEMLYVDAHELERSKFAATAMLRIWTQAGPASRELALRSLITGLRLGSDTAGLAHSAPATDDYSGHVHLPVSMRLVCSQCLAEPTLPDRAEDLVVRLAAAGPLSVEEQMDLASDRFLDLLLSRPAAKNPTTLDVKLARLLSEADR